MPVSAVPPAPAVGGSGVDMADMEVALLVAYASVRFILDIEEIGRADRDQDLVGGLIFAAIAAANLAPVMRDPALQKTYSALDSPAPETLLRPVSVSAVAHSLRMPFETVRRRIRIMIRNGLIADAPGGVVVFAAALGSGSFLVSMAARHQRLGVFYAEVKAVGALPHDADAPAPAPTPPPIRISNRAVWGYVLRVVDDLMNLTGDVLNALVFLGIIRANITGLSPEAMQAWTRSPFAHALPIRISPLARRLNLSPESCRRYAIALEQAGLCRRTERGLIACVPPTAMDGVDRGVRANLANVQRMFANLRQLGALEVWDKAEVVETTAATA
jgi:DNA-binding Lrp family transcriptional regulator